MTTSSSRCAAGPRRRARRAALPPACARALSHPRRGLFDRWDAVADLATRLSAPGTAWATATPAVELAFWLEQRRTTAYMLAHRHDPTEDIDIEADIAADEREMARQAAEADARRRRLQ